MMQTVLWIPETLAGFPVFGVGLVLAAWVFVAVAITAYQYRAHGWSNDLASQLGIFALIAGAIVFLAPNLMEGEPGHRFFAIRGFGVMLLLAIVSGVGISAYRAKQVGIDPELIFELAFWSILWGVIGARVFYVIQYWHEFEAPTLAASIGKMVNAAKGGLVVYGSVIGGFTAGYLYLRKKNIPVWKLADIVAPGMILGQAIGRLGCFMNGCCYGGLCTLPFAVSFPPTSPVYVEQQKEGLFHGLELREVDDQVVIANVQPSGPAERAGLKVGDRVQKINGAKIEGLDDARNRLLLAGPEVELVTAENQTARWTLARLPAWSLPVHPTQIYSFLDAAILCLFLWAYYPYRRRDGEVFALLVTLHPISRFLLELIRTDEPGRFGTGLTISQLFSIAFFLGACGLWWWLETRGTPVKDATVTPSAA